MPIDVSKSLVFFGCKKPDFSDTGGPQYTAQFNPSTFHLALDIDRNFTQAIGNGYTPGNFKYVKPQDVKFDFTLDATGTGKPLKNGDIPSEIKAFLSVVYVIEGSEHQPHYVKAIFGDVTIKGVATNVDITYTLFRADGMPLRAKISVTIASTMDPKLGEIVQNKSSPDLTHKVTMTQTDRLVSLAYSIYKNNNYYSDVAKVNGFNNFRRLPTGTDIFFPPLDK
jgi:hypothetical protein